MTTRQIQAINEPNDLELLTTGDIILVDNRGDPEEWVYVGTYGELGGSVCQDHLVFTRETESPREVPKAILRKDNITPLGGGIVEFGGGLYGFQKPDSDRYNKFIEALRKSQGARR